MVEDFDQAIDFEQLKLDVAALLEGQREIQSKISEVKGEVTELEKQWRLKEREERELRRQQEALNTKIREAEKALSTAARLKEVEAEKERIRKEFEEKSAYLDELTATAYWREFAFDHQIEGGKQLALAKRGILGDKRGLGKTLSGLIYADMLQAKKILVIAPNDVVAQFQDEINTWTQRTVFPLSSLPKAQRTFAYPILKDMEEVIATINYEAWRRDKTIIDDLVAVGFDTVICDEAHRAKSWNKVTARGIFQVIYRPNWCENCKKVENYAGSWADTDTGLLVDINYLFGVYTCPTCGTRLSSTVANTLSMTGTPFLNKPQELFSLLYIVNPRMFPNEKAFLRDYCYQYEPGKWRFAPGGLKRLTDYMSEFFLQRTREDAGIQIPPPAVTIHRIDKDAIKYAKQYKAERELNRIGALLLEDNTRKDVFFALEMILRERQLMTWPAGIRITDPETKELLCHFDVRESQKLDEATDLLKELLDEGERVIVFSQFVDPLREMHSRIYDNGYKGVMATGDTPKHTREQIRMDFDLKTAPEEPRWNVAFATYKAFGTGVNLNAARHIIILDDEWNPGGEDQAIGRIDRLNSVDQANVHIFRVNDSVDDFMEALLEEKRASVEGFETAPAFERLREFFTKRNEE